MKMEASRAGQKLLVVGNLGVAHVGAHFNHAARGMNLSTVCCDSREASRGNPWVGRFNWWLRGRRPSRLREFSDRVVRACRELRPTWMLCTGIAPVERSALLAIGNLGVQRLNYLTDDPWNPAHRAPWFMKSLPLYDHVFSPRRANVEDLERLGCPRVSYLPFAYVPELHFPDAPASPDEEARFAADVIFAGGADADRVPCIATLIRAGFRVALYGGYWQRYSETRAHARGHAGPETLRKAIGGAKTALCLVRRANRDGHAMRTFEVPAIGTCMLTEATEEHREILGEEGEATIYFRTEDEMIRKLRWLLAHDDERRRLAQALHRRIIDGRHTYRDRLATLLRLVGSDELPSRASVA